MVVISIAWVIFAYFDNRMGINEFGLCGQTYLRVNYVEWFFPILQIILNFAFLSFSFYTYYYFKRHKPQV